MNLENYFPVLLFILVGLGVGVVPQVLGYLFDLETAFFFPWGVSMRELGWSGFVTMMVFIAEFVVGFWYIWKKGALDWE